MAIRAQPVKAVFQRMARLVREVADAASGKSVRLVAEGEATEVDRTVIERLTDPLTHMIRNAVDHGVEKSGAARRRRQARRGPGAHLGGHQSRGTDRHRGGRRRPGHRPRARAAIAVAQGLVAADASLADEDVDNLIFAPGFSTADSVSDISGRGVGMDVVRRACRRSAAASRSPRARALGSTFTLSLPLTLAVLDGMVVKVADQTLVVPLTRS